MLCITTNRIWRPVAQKPADKMKQSGPAVRIKDPKNYLVSIVASGVVAVAPALSPIAWAVVVVWSCQTA
jgi:hypothetical protein